MSSQSWPKLFLASFMLILCLTVVQAWRADHRDRAQLAAELAATKQLLTAADTRQRDRDAQLAQTLSALEAQKRTMVTPTQILRQLPKSLPLPAPITVQSVQAHPENVSASSTTREVLSSSATNPASTSHQKPAPDGALIPGADLKPLYDFTLACQACQAKLLAAQGNLADEKSKTAALAKERDDAVRIAKGGSAWRRVTRAAKWFLLGAAAGAIAAKTTH